MWQGERDKMHKKGVAAQKAEKDWVKKVNRLHVMIPDALLYPIEDPKALWKASDQIWKELEAKKVAKKGKMPDHTEGEDEGDKGDEGATFLLD